MNDKLKADFHSGRIRSQEPIDISGIVDELNNAQEGLKHWPVDKLIEIFAEFGSMLMDQRLSLHKKYPNSGIPYIAGWCRKTNLISLLESAFFSRYVLDRFVGSDTRSDRSYRAFPKGLVVHWMAGNVPTLSFLSLIQGVLTKNANLIKIASGTDDLLAQLLALLSTVNAGESYSGRDLVRSIAVIRYHRSQKDLSAAISRQADVRIFWGSNKGVAELRALPAKLHSCDLIFSNKTSFMVIDSSSLSTMDTKTIAKQVATDVSVFEQKACASPHTMFLETKDTLVLEKFVLCLKEALDKTLTSIPKSIPSQHEISAILNLRAQYDMFHQAWYSDGIEYTILSDDFVQLGPPIGNRTLFIRKIDDLEHIANLITPEVQSVGILAEKEKFERLTGLFAEKGVQRFTNIGAMTHFESPWDGYMPSHYLIRWVSRPRQN